MSEPPSENVFEQGRIKTYAGDDKDLYSDVGFFITWYATVELQITRLLAEFTHSHDLEAFDILCRGMDAGVKTERLRKAIKRVGKMGPELNVRLGFFTDEGIKLRNKIVHSVFSTSEDDGPRRYFLSGLANMPWVELGMGPPKTTRKPETVLAIDLYKMGVWFSVLTHDLSRVRTLRKQIEIEEPKSKVPEAYRLRYFQKSPHAKPDTPPQNSEA